MGKVKGEKEIEKWPLFIERTCQQETIKSKTSTPAWDDTLFKDWNNPCAKASAASNTISQPLLTTIKTSPILFISLILTVIGCVFEVKSREVCDFNDKTNDSNDGFELECELECGASSPGNKRIVAIPHTTAPEFISTLAAVGISQASVSAHELSIQITQGIKNENEIKNGSGRLCGHKQVDSHTATTSTALKNNGMHNYDSIDAESHEFSDLEYVLDVVRIT